MLYLLVFSATPKQGVKDMAATQRKPATKQRTLNFLPAANLIFVNEGKKSCGYVIVETTENQNGDEQPRSFRLEKADGTVYNVLVNGNDSLCDCIGFEHRGMHTKDGKGCKHIAALIKLLQLGKL